MSRKITAIEPQKRNPRRVNVYLDGEFAFGLAPIVAAWLKVGQELTEERISALRADDERERVYQQALHFISFRPRSSWEVRENLRRRHLAPALIEETMERLQQDGWLDDQAFARAWVENRNTFRPRAPSALRLELRRKGISEEIIQSVLESVGDVEELALEAARKYVRKLHGLDPAAFRKKLGGFLTRRGFAYEVIRPVCRRIWDELQAGDRGMNYTDEE